MFPSVYTEWLLAISSWDIVALARALPLTGLLILSPGLGQHLVHRPLSVRSILPDLLPVLPRLLPVLACLLPVLTYRGPL